ncbi:MAG: ABC transporter permease [Desulfuromonadaceae bacterium]
MLKPLAYMTSVVETYRMIIRYRKLLIDMTRREIMERHAGQTLGFFWSIGQPLVMCILYLAVFGFVFKLRPPASEEFSSARRLTDYSVYLLSGMIPWIALQDIMGRSTSAILNQANLVKQVVFPVIILPLRCVGTTVFNMCIFLGMFIIYQLSVYRALPITVALLPALLIMQILFMSGIALIFSTVSVFFKDLREIVQMSCAALMFIMPVFYTMQDLPRWFKPVILANPLSHIILCWQDVLYFGRIENPASWGVVALLSVVTFSLGCRIFRALNPILGNVL